MTEQDLIETLKILATQRAKAMLVFNSRGEKVASELVAYEIGLAVQETYNRIGQMGYLPIAMPKSCKILVDFKRWEERPLFTVIVRF